MADEQTGPSSDLIPLLDSIDDTTATVLWGMEGTGKTGLVISSWPLPILVCNLDRHLQPQHIADPKTRLSLPAERLKNVVVKNLREDMTDLSKMSQAQALSIKTGIEQVLKKNLDWLKGGTFLLDGGTMYRQVLKMADESIGAKLAAGQKFNPKDRETINAYLGMLVSYIADQGIHFVVTAHAAWSWEMKAVDDNRNQLTKTTKMYPQLDDMFFKRGNLSVLLYKRCACGLAITTDDGSCTAVTAQTSDVNLLKHRGRKHIARIVTNKFNTGTEGSEWPDVTYGLLHDLCFDQKKAELLMSLKG